LGIQDQRCFKKIRIKTSGLRNPDWKGLGLKKIRIKKDVAIQRKVEPG